MTTKRNRAEKRADPDVDVALAAVAQGVAPTSDDANALPDGENPRETDAIGEAARLVIADGEPLGGPDQIEERDAHRWELDPASADELAAVEKTSSNSSAAPTRRHPGPSPGER